MQKKSLVSRTIAKGGLKAKIFNNMQSCIYLLLNNPCKILSICHWSWKTWNVREVNPFQATIRYYQAKT